ncbi:MAG TPA: long-chain fatty acid--CoA ligase [Gemmatimonadaceae bacterium]
MRTEDQLSAALALIETDGIARRLVLCPPDLVVAHLPYVVTTAAVDIVITDRGRDDLDWLPGVRVVTCARTIHRAAVDRAPQHETEWILFTSGTTGLPKMVVHTLATLTGAIAPAGGLAGSVSWATFYDVRRYGGLQILLRAVLGGGSLVLSDPNEAAAAFLARAREHHVSHITGTPSHWRRALMSSAARAVSPAYARLSGEIADQTVLDQMRSSYPHAKVAHAFASTEAGVAFEVTDDLAGFPVGFIGPNESGVHLAVEDDTLRVRSSRTALHYLGNQGEALLDANGFVDTGDVVEQRGDRYYFVGRRGGIINVGGLKIHPEEVEAVINRHPGVRMSLVSARKNPITGSVVTAEVVLAPDSEQMTDTAVVAMTKDAILERCRATLPTHKVPASIRIVDSLPVGPSGKVARRNG